MYTTTQASFQSSANGGVDFGSNVSDDFAGLAHLASSSGAISADVNSLQSTIKADDDGAIDSATNMFRGSCPDVSAINNDGFRQQRASCPAIEVTPAEAQPLSSLVPSPLLLCNGSNNLTPPLPVGVAAAGSPFGMEDIFQNMPSSGTSDASQSSFDDRGGSPYSELSLSDELSQLSEDDFQRRFSMLDDDQQYLAVPLRQEGPKPAVSSTVTSKYEWPKHYLECSRQEFTQLTHSNKLSSDQLDDLRKARRRHKNRRYQKSARKRHQERRERGLESKPRSAACLRREIDHLKGQNNQMQLLCQDMMALLQECNPAALGTLKSKHPLMFSS